MNLDKIIDIIPQILTYIMPGYISIYIYTQEKHEKEQQNNHIILMSMVISFILITVLDSLVILINLFLKADIQLNSTIRILLLLVLSLIYTWLWFKYTGSIIENYIKKIAGNNSINRPTVWNYAMECSNGAWARVYLREDNIAYVGKLINYTNNPNDKCKEILLQSFSSIQLDSKETLSNYTDDNKMVLINCSSIKSIEILKD